MIILLAALVSGALIILGLGIIGHALLGSADAIVAALRGTARETPVPPLLSERRRGREARVIRRMPLRLRAAA
jgi:hypothetical protein